MKRILVFGLAAVLATACSIKEDRSACPGWLNIRLSERSMAIAGRYPVRLTVSHAGGVDSLSLGAEAPGAWVPVERGSLRVEGLLANGSDGLPAWGWESDSLWTFSSRGSLASEEGTLEVELHKRFATVWFIFDMEPDASDVQMVVRSDSFCCMLPIEGEPAAVRLPALGEGAVLGLDCLAREDGGLVWSWDIAAALAKEGYDWGADDLADARVRVSIAPLDLSVDVLPWTEGDGFVWEL